MRGCENKREQYRQDPHEVLTVIVGPPVKLTMLENGPPSLENYVMLHVRGSSSIFFKTS